MTAAIAAPAFRERPILFSAPMIKAILAGVKSQTRRLVSERDVSIPLVSLNPAAQWSGGGFWWYEESGGMCTVPGRCPYGAPGDQLWVRETWGLHAHHDETDWFRGSVRGVPADSLQAQYHFARRADWGPLQEGCFWRPAIFMPRWASRITLEITEVRVQRLQDISEDDARAEGVRIPDAATAKQDTVDTHGMTPYRAAFACLWESINGKRIRRVWDDTAEEWRTVVDTSARWDANPWVWALTFRRLP